MDTLQDKLDAITKEGKLTREWLHDGNIDLREALEMMNEVASHEIL